jgi:hypothetical protein
LGAVKFIATPTYTNYLLTLAIQEVSIAGRAIDSAMLGGMR